MVVGNTSVSIACLVRKCCSEKKREEGIEREREKDWRKRLGSTSEDGRGEQHQLSPSEAITCARLLSLHHCQGQGQLRLASSGGIPWWKYLFNANLRTSKDSHRGRGYACNRGQCGPA